MAKELFVIGLFWPLMLTSASTPLTAFDLCGVNEITTENVSLMLNFTTEYALKVGEQCGLAIILKSKRVMLTVEELSIASEAVFEIQEGPGVANGGKIGPKDGSQLPSFYVTLGNAMFIRFKDVSQGKNGPSIFRGKISSAPFQDTCHCRGVRNGKLECFETTEERKCELKCNPSFMELTLKKEILTCDFKNGTWDINIHSGPLECEKVQKPVQIKATVNFNYANLTCRQVDRQGVESAFRAILGNNSDVRSKGLCFNKSAADYSDCKQAVQVNCSINGRLAEITITILDRIAEPLTLEEANSKLQELNTAYNNLKVKDVLDLEALVMKEGNLSFTISKESIVATAAPSCNGENDYIRVPGNATYFVCSTCPWHHLYNVTTRTCQKCPSGSTAHKRARSCTQRNNTSPATPLRMSCDNKCMKGKWLGSKSGMCEWCPRNQYQNSSTKINPECVSCPDDKLTIFPGAQNVSDCRDPCLNGTFMNALSGTCMDCPVGTYMDIDKHASTHCKMCEMGKTTADVGSKSASDCYQCLPGKFYNATAMICTSCPVGKYQDEMNKNSCKDCASGTTNLELGSKTSSDCIKVCGLGKFLNNSKCFDCPENTYQDLREHNSTECKPCGPNKITNATGQSDVSSCFVSCEEGWFLDKSVSQCKKCRTGHYQDQPGQDQCKPCPDGKSTTSEGQKNVSSCSVVLCRKGEFYETSNETCNACPYGTYQEATNHQLKSCQICQSKKTFVNKGAEDSKQCISSDGKGSAEVAVKMSVKFISLSWSEELKDKKSVLYNKTKTMIEEAIKYELQKDLSFEGIKVTALTKGSVVAEFELYFNDKVDYVPGEALQVAVRSGKVGNLLVTSDSLRVLQHDCTQPLGMESGKIKNEQITASTFLKHYEPYEGRLNLKGGRGWYAEYNKKIEYLQIDFKRVVNITAVATQGKSKGSFYVKEYKLSLSDGGKNWTEYTENGKIKVFRGNYDSDTVVQNNLSDAISSRFIRFLPQSWNKDIFMRVEVYGCLRNALLPTEPSMTAASTPDVAAITSKHDKWPWGAYLGIVFAVLLIVGIVIAVICWKKQSKEKNNAAETDHALMGISKHGDGEYRIIEKNAAEPDDDDDENVV